MCGATSLWYDCAPPPGANPQPQSTQGTLPACSCFMKIKSPISWLKAQPLQEVVSVCLLSQPARAVFQQQVRPLRAHPSPHTNPQLPSDRAEPAVSQSVLLPPVSAEAGTKGSVHKLLFTLLSVPLEIPLCVGLSPFPPWCVLGCFCGDVEVYLLVL